MAKVDHLQMIQGVINRMASNSFMLKGWSVLMVSALFALMAESGITDSSLIFLVFTALLMFWGLDGYFLWQERLYRKLYDNTRKEIGEETDYSMNTQDYMKEVDSWLKVCMSKTLLGFHGVMTAALGLYFLIRCLQK